jgi:hypothetical protein
LLTDPFWLYPFGWVTDTALGSMEARASNGDGMAST